MTGEWIEREPTYLAFDIYNCEYCGKNIPRHVWLEDFDDVKTPFCAPAVAALFDATRERGDSNVRRADATLTLTEQLVQLREICVAISPTSREDS